MKKQLLIFLLVLSSCRQESKKDVEKPPAPVSPEQQLKNDVDRYPDSLLLKENLIEYYHELKDYDHAIAEVDNALRKDSDNARLWHIKGVLHVEDEDTANAIHAYATAVRIAAIQKDIVELAELYAYTKNKNALILTDSLLAHDSKGVERDAFYIKGAYYSAINEKEKAISFFDKCIAINFTFMPAYREKAIALYDMKKYTDALAVLEKAVTLQNSYEEGYYYKGRCFEKLNKIPDAINAYQTALLYDPDYIEAKDALSKLEVKN